MKYPQILTWLGAVITAAAVTMTFLFTTFQTNASADRVQNTVEHRLDQLDAKLDQILEQTK